jgi:hypothetical protein
MGTRVLAKTHFFSSEIDSRFSYFSTFSKSQLRFGARSFGARSFGARSLLHSRTCVYARACMRVRVCAYKMVKSFAKTVHTLTKSNLLK